jgi:hypothetical protein
LLLLPQSLQQPWVLQLNDGVAGLGLEARHDEPGRGLLPLAPARRADAARGAACWRVMLREPLGVPLDAALGWQAPAPWPLPVLGAAAGLFAPQALAPCAQGVLVPALGAAALLISDVT